MNPDNYLQRALDELKKDNKIGALSILEEGYARFRDNRLGELLEKIRGELSHLRDIESYRAFYERQQRKPEKYYKFTRRLERKIRHWLGRDVRRVVEGCLRNPRYLRLEKDIREGNFHDILDLGCWEGHFAIALGCRNPSIRVTGLDIASTNIEIANELNRFKNVRFGQGTAEDIGKLFPPESFDFVMLFEILEHVIDVERVLTAVLAVLKPGGKIAITVPAAEEEDHHDEHVRFFSDSLIQELFGNRPGLVIETVPHPPRPGKPQEFSRYITFRKT
jgi:2-polyprenyl-3-methyl-5-hydroxy-6-metoxy-1,4-benzoquinol methylase